MSIKEEGKKELLNEFAFQSTAVIERIGLDANLLVYDLVVDVRDLMVKAIKTNKRYRKAFYSFYFSMRRFPRVSAAMHSFIMFGNL